MAFTAATVFVVVVEVAVVGCNAAVGAAADVVGVTLCF